MVITRTQATMLIELQAMIACEDVPRTSSSVDGSVGISLDKPVGVVGAISVDDAMAAASNTVDIGDHWGAASSSSRSLGEDNYTGRGDSGPRTGDAIKVKIWGVEAAWPGWI